jgi:hypothetical protein
MGKPSRDKGAEYARARARYAEKIARERVVSAPRAEFGCEEWRVLPGLPDYEISNYGDVRRSTRARTRFPGHRPAGHLRGGYWSYKLVGPGGKTTVWAHRAVLEAFSGPAPTAAHVCAHADGNRLNNYISNLRWATHAENCADTALHGSLKGARNPRARLTPEQVAEARPRYTGKWGEQSRLAREYGLSPSAMRSVLVGEHWNG